MMFGGTNWAVHRVLLESRNTPLIKRSLLYSQKESLLFLIFGIKFQFIAKNLLIRQPYDTIIVTEMSFIGLTSIIFGEK